MHVHAKKILEKSVAQDPRYLICSEYFSERSGPKSGKMAFFGCGMQGNRERNELKKKAMASSEP